MCRKSFTQYEKCNSNLKRKKLILENNKNNNWKILYKSIVMIRSYKIDYIFKKKKKKESLINITWKCHDIIKSSNNEW